MPPAVAGRYPSLADAPIMSRVSAAVPPVTPAATIGAPAVITATGAIPGDADATEA